MHALFVFFFQADDVIRDLYVTGVQTCALPISIRNAAELFAQAKESTPELRTASDILRRQVRVLAHLVDDLLDVSRITAGRIVQIGRASCRERVWISVGAVVFKTINMIITEIDS